MFVRQYQKVKWSNNIISKELFLEKSKAKVPEFRVLDSVDKDGMKFMDKDSIRKNRLHD